MIKSVDFNLEYREKGERKNKMLTIDFISNGVIKRYDKLMGEINEISQKSDERQELLIDIVNLRMEKPEGWKDLQKDKKNKVDEIETLIKSFHNNGHFERRFEIIKTILEDNGIKDDKFLTFDFWENSVDASSMIEFINMSIWKDLQSDKKKV